MRKIREKDGKRTGKGGEKMGKIRWKMMKRGEKQRGERRRKGEGKI